MKWGSFLGGCALLIFLPLNIYVVRIHCICLIYYPTLLNNVGPKWFNVWDGFNGVRPLGVHGSFCNPWSTLHSRPVALYGCSAQNLLQWKVGVLAFLTRCNLSTRRKDDFIMITNSFLPWRSDHLSLTEGSIVHAPTKRCDLFKYSYSKDLTFFNDVMNVNSWKHLLVTSRPKRLFIGRDHFQSEWFYRLASLSLPASPIGQNFCSN